MKGYFIALLIGFLAGPLGVIGQADVNFLGTSRETRFGDVILEFRGIRYAEPPIGELRFKAPVAVNITAGSTVNATADGPMCPQSGDSRLISEDCLFLNVFTKNRTGSVPVLVYIHGGAYVSGSGHSSDEASPDYLLRHDVVLVAFNFRLGALGFLSTRSEEAPGNFGFLDQVMALQWVQTNIWRFGGDPQSVTLFGMSSGAMSVTLHMASPLSAGLFHRAIAMSGSATNHFHIDNLEYTRKLAREVSCPLYTPRHVVDCLRTVSWQRIMEVCEQWQVQSFYLPNFKWNYEVDGHFLTDHPTEVFRLGKFHKVPLITGITRDELDFAIYIQESDKNAMSLLSDISENFDLYAPELFHFNASEPAERKFKGDSIKRFYLGNRTDIGVNNSKDFSKIFSDALIGHGVHRLVDLASRYVHVFYYRLDYESKFSNSVDFEGKPLGVGHRDDLQYLMPSVWKGPAYNEESLFMIERMTEWWTSFAKHGAPYRPNDTVWDSAVSYNITTLYNNKEAKMDEAPYADRYKLWDELFPVSKDSGAQNLRLSWLLGLAPALQAVVLRL